MTATTSSPVHQLRDWFVQAKHEGLVDVKFCIESNSGASVHDLAKDILAMNENIDAGRVHELTPSDYGEVAVG